jgi:hypothetical protein
MKKLIFLMFIVIFSQVAFAQSSLNRYEVEVMMNPNKGGKDTREVNAVLVFEKDSVKIISRRKKNLVYKDFNIKDIKYVEHSFSKTPFMSAATKAVFFTILTGLPLFYSENEKHWLTLVTGNDFAVLKIENDNYRLLKNEFMIRDFDVVNINEDRQ